jgi:hypothetical protein
MPVCALRMRCESICSDGGVSPLLYYTTHHQRGFVSAAMSANEQSCDARLASGLVCAHLLQPLVRKQPYWCRRLGWLYKGRRRVCLNLQCSWGDDEDFSLLLDALKSYDVLARKRTSKLPNILMLITGRGARRDYYMNLFEREKFEYAKTVGTVVVVRECVRADTLKCTQCGWQSTIIHGYCPLLTWAFACS